MSGSAGGGCVLVGLGGGALAGVFAASPTAGILTSWAVGTAALALAARRRMSDSSATPPPVGVAPRSDIDADQARKAARAATDPNGVMCIVHPVREEVKGS